MKYAFLNNENIVLEIIEVESFDDIPTEKFNYPIRANITDRKEVIVVGSVYKQEIDKFE